MALTNEEITLLKAYTAYKEAGQRFLGAKYRARVEADALQAEINNMQDALSMILTVAVTRFDGKTLELLLPAKGRTGRSTTVNVPDYKILNLAGKKSAALVRGADNVALIPDFGEVLVPHQVTIVRNQKGLAPLFGELIRIEVAKNEFEPVFFSFAL